MSQSGGVLQANVDTNKPPVVLFAINRLFATESYL